MNKLNPLFVLMVLFIFAASCVSKEVPVTETYYETEYRTEPYTTTEDVVIDKVCGDEILSTIIGSESEFTPRPCIWSQASSGLASYYEYKIPQHDISRIEVTLPEEMTPTGRSISIYDVSKAKQSHKWEDAREIGKLEGVTYELLQQFLVATHPEQRKELWQSMANPPRQLEFNSENITNLAILCCFCNDSTGPIQTVRLIWCDEITERKMVTKEKQVPYEAEKQRTVMQTKKVPFWEGIFR